MSAPDKPFILLAEDSEDDAYFFKRAFARAGLTCELQHAGNGKHAVELIDASGTAGKAPALVFLDLKMPVMSGFEVLQWLQRSPLEPKPKVIVLSGSNDHGDRARAFDLGAQDYLVKPITSDILRARVLGTVDCKASPSPAGGPS